MFIIGVMWHKSKERVRPILEAMGGLNIFDFGEEDGAANQVQHVGNFMIASAVYTIKDCIRIWCVFMRIMMLFQYKWQVHNDWFSWCEVEPFVTSWTSEKEQNDLTLQHTNGDWITYKNGEIMRHVIAQYFTVSDIKSCSTLLQTEQRSAYNRNVAPLRPVVSTTRWR